MTTDTVLTQEQIDALFNECMFGPDPQPVFARAIEQAVLQSPEVRRLREMAEWQPFETAPQGALCLFYDAKAVDVPSCMFTDWVVDGRFCGNRHHTATHWMQLPPHPASP